MNEQERISEFNETTETYNLWYWWYGTGVEEEPARIHDAWACGFEVTE